MRGLIIAAIVLVVVGYFASQFSKMVKAKMDLSQRVTLHYLDLVDEQSIESVKEDLVEEAAKVGVVLEKEKISVVYQDSEKQLYPQRVLGKVAEFKNKQVGIAFRYHWRILGFGISQEITGRKIKQVQIKQKVRPEYEELLK